MISAMEVREQLCEVGRRVYRSGHVAANDGNFSVRVAENEFYCTPANVSKGYMTPDMMVHLDGEGNLLEPCGDWRPSSEFKMHLRAYQERPDIGAVVHAHPPCATAHAACALPLDAKIMSEAVFLLGAVPLTPYGTPSTMEIPDAISGAFETHNAVLLQNHGALTVGEDLTQAYYLMETLEHWAKVSIYTRILGGAREIPPEKVDQLMTIRAKSDTPGRHPLL